MNRLLGSIGLVLLLSIGCKSGAKTSPGAGAAGMESAPAPIAAATPTPAPPAAKPRARAAEGATGIGGYLEGARLADR